MEMLKGIKLPQGLRRNLPVWLGLAGIGLIFLSSWLPDTGQEAAPAASVTSFQSQQQQLEEQLTRLVSSIQGAGETVVMVTLDTESEQVYATDQTTESTLSEQQQTSRQETSHVLLQDGSGQQPLVETTYLPQVRGVAVVCQGGEDITVVTRITEAVSVVLDLPASRICVTKMN